MHVPTLNGLIRRRLLINYRVDPDVARSLLPEPFAPKLYRGQAIAGICLIRLEAVRPAGLPAFIGVSSENAAHRLAVTWNDPITSEPKDGVYIPQRHTSCALNVCAGGKLFPGVQHHARFKVRDTPNQIQMLIQSRDTQAAIDQPLVSLTAQPTNDWPTDSIFPSLAAASAFFDAGCIGYSSRPDSCTLDGMKLVTTRWHVTPLQMLALQSAWYDDPIRFPQGSIQLDHALLMRDIPHQWLAQPEMETGGVLQTA